MTFKKFKQILTCSCPIQLFFPALLGHRWVCYTWDLLTNTITIFDPSLSAPEEKRALYTNMW